MCAVDRNLFPPRLSRNSHITSSPPLLTFQIEVATIKHLAESSPALVMGEHIIKVHPKTRSKLTPSTNSNPNSHPIPNPSSNSNPNPNWNSYPISNPKQVTTTEKGTDAAGDMIFNTVFTGARLTQALTLALTLNPNPGPNPEP